MSALTILLRHLRAACLPRGPNELLAIKSRAPSAASFVVTDGPIGVVEPRPFRSPVAWRSIPWILMSLIICAS
jgi:hypothetical protein